MHTYVERADEDELRRALEIDGVVVSIVGPTKTGKTVLVNKVVGEAELITVPGGLVERASDVWKIAAGSMGLAELTALETIEMAVSENMVLLIDDFHYVERGEQKRIAEQIKDATVRGLRIVVAAVPHRADDAVRGNPDLRGRVLMIDLDYWDAPELESIADIGFPLLNIDLAGKSPEILAEQSLRAPQLMQLLCLEACRIEGVDAPSGDRRTIELSESEIQRVCSKVAQYTDSSTAYQIARDGPQVRGQPRSLYKFKDGSEGDVYQLVLRSLVQPTPLLSAPLATLKSRAAALLQGSNHSLGGSIRNSVKQMDRLLKERLPNERVLEWDGDRQTLNVLDPYFAYYLRWGPTLDENG